MKRYIGTITVITFIILWTYSGLEKLLNWSQSWKAFHNQPFPGELATLLTYGVPIIEVILAILLMVKAFRWFGLMGSVLLLTVFTTYVGLVYWEAFDRVPCNCAGFIEAMGWAGHFYFNALLLAAGITALWIDHSIGNRLKTQE